MQHTPGPWTIAPGRDKTHPHNIESRSPECDGFDLARCVLIDDARLIAAAPDLLAALLDALPYVEDVLSDPAQLAAFKPGTVQRHAKAIRAAIAAAKGQA